MSQVPKVRKHQDGGTAQNTSQSYSAPTLSFMVDGQRFDIDEHSLNAELNRYIDSDPRLAKSRDKILQAFSATKDNIKSGMGSGQFINISPGGDRATSATTDLDMSDSERGLNRRGNAAKSGILAGITGITRDNVINGVVNNFLADSVSRTFTVSQQRQEEETRQAELKAKQEQEKAEQDEKARATADSNSRYNDVSSTFDITTNLFGPQIGMDRNTLTEANIRRYWEGNEENPEAQRSIANRYFGRVRDMLNREDILADEDIVKKWKEQYNVDLNSARELLNSVNLDDPNTNLQEIADNIGIGTKYAALNNRSMWEGLKGAADVSTTSDKGPEPFYILDGDQYKNAQGEVGSGWQNIDGDEIHLTDGRPSTGTIDNLTLLDGRRYTGVIDTPDTAYEEYWGERYSPFAIEGVNATTRGDFWDNEDYRNRYSDAHKEVDARMNTVREWMQGQNWSSVTNLKSDQRNPYLKGPDQNVTDFIDDSWKFGEAIRKDNGHMNFSIIREKTNDGRYRTRYNDATFDETGYIIADRYGNKKFISDRKDSRGQPVLTRNLGQDVSRNEEHRNKYLNNANIHSWNKNRANRLRNTLAENVERSKGVNFTGGLKEGGKLEISNELRNKLNKFQTGGTIHSSYNTDAVVDPRRGISIGSMFDDDYELTSSDKAELAALTAEIGGLGLSFVPGANIAAAGAGAVGSLASHTARKTRGENVSGWGLAGDLALDAATAIPVLGGVAKSWKAANSFRKSLPVLAKLASAGFGGAQFASGVQAAMNGDFSTETIRKIVSGLTGMRHGYAGRIGSPNKAMTKGAPENSLSINVKGKPVNLNLTADEASKIKGLSGTKQTEAIKKLAISKKLATDVGDIEIATTRGGFNLTPWKSRANVNVTQSSSRILTPDEVGDNPILRRAAKRAAAENPEMKGAEFWRTTWYGSSKTPNTPELIPESRRISRMKPVEGDGFTMNHETSNRFRNGGIIKLQLGRTVPKPNVSPASTFNLFDNRRRFPFPALLYNAEVNIPTHSVFTQGADFAKNLNNLTPPYNTIDIPVGNRYTVNMGVSNAPSRGTGFSSGSGTSNNPIMLDEVAIPPVQNTGIRMPDTVIPDPTTVDVEHLRGVNNPASSASVRNPNTTGIKSETIAPKTNVTPEKISFNYNPVDVSEGLRALFNMATAANVDTRVEAPLLSHVQEIIPGVKGNFLGRNAYSRGANRIRQQADMPFTTDAGVQMAGRLGANAQAEELDVQGALLDSQSVAQQEANNVNAARQYASGRQAISNQNVSTMANRDQAERQLKNQQNLAIRQSMDNFWANQNMRAYRNQMETREIDDAKYQLQSMNEPIGTIAKDLGMDPTTTRSQAITAITNELNNLYAIPEASRTPQQVERMRLLNEQASLIQQQASLASLDNRRSLIGGKTATFTLPGMYRKGVDTTAFRKKGGRLSFDERMKLEVFKVKSKNQDSWLKEYTNWVKNKGKNDTDMQIQSAKGVQELVKQALSPKIK